jgi:hypothetical protein
MDRELRSILAQCISDMDRGASVEDCLKRNQTRANEIRPHLETWRALSGVSVPQIQPARFDRGRQALFAALATRSHRKTLSPLRLAPAWATAAAGIFGAVLLLGGAAGTSAALGGPNVAGDVFDAVGVTNGGGGISHSNASERGLACANPNAFDGSLNSEDKSQNAEDAKSKEPCAEDESSEEAGETAGEVTTEGNNEGASENGINNAPDAADNGKENANPNAFEGSGNADDRGENGNGNGPQSTGNAGGQPNNGHGEGNAGQGQGGGNAGGNQ